ncbi:MAG: prephenate dehydrogenase [Acidimicrobiaceae bacterium]|nr:prephenate dehydrogenase [Acidimicrobiaceae bacterium]
MPQQQKAIISGTGLIGGSVGMALRRDGWHVTGFDTDPQRTTDAIAVGAIDRIGEPGPYDLGVVATPVDQLAGAAQQLLEAGTKLVTDVGSVKTPVATEITDPRFVAGHPMAGNEQKGLTGSSAELFDGAVWVLTPTVHTDDNTLTEVRKIVTEFGAQAIVLTPEKHDRLVALVSHVPMLTATTLVRVARRWSSEHRAVLRLAAGGFRDMTRIASANSAIWPGICSANSTAIIEALEQLIDELKELRGIVAGNDTDELLARLEEARKTRLNLPTTAPETSKLVELRVIIPDEKGQLAKIAMLAADLDINIYDIHIVHSVEGPHGLITILIQSDSAPQMRDSLIELGYRPLIVNLG